MVQGDDTDDMDAPRIPDTDAYTAMGSYKALDNAASGPMGMQRELGEINRDGTTVHLPYLTTNNKFSQRLRIVNRSSADAKYEMEFHGADDEAGSMATGMLDGDSITVMNLRDGMVVTPGNGNSTSGTLIVEADSGDIDVATIQVNRELGTTDRAGGTAIKHAMGSAQASISGDGARLPYVVHLHRHAVGLRDVPAGERFFFFVRDPVGRFVSGFYSRQRKGRPRYSGQWSEREREAYRRFGTPDQLASALSSVNDEERNGRRPNPR